jgi:DNA replication protein DnaC
MAVKQDWEYEELLSKLFQAELDHRNYQLITRKIKSARFKKKALLEDLDWSVKRGITKPQIQELMTLKWVEQARPIVLMGQTGIGKSFLAEALGRYACTKKRSVLFKDGTELFIQIQEARRLNKYLGIRDRLSRVDLLIIDDFGMRKLSSTEAQDLKELLEVRSLDKATIFTTQLPLAHWREVIEDEVILEAIIDLIEHSSIKIEMKGESYRKIKAKKLDSQELKN